MVVVVADTFAGQNLAGLIDLQCQCILPEPQNLEALLRHRQPDAIILHWSSARSGMDFLEAALLSGLPLIVVLPRSAFGAQVAVDLARHGVRNFRFEDENSDWSAYLFQIIDAHRRQGILQSTHEYLESLHVVHIERTRSVLDSLQMGLMVIEGAGDGQLMHYNHRLELLLNRELDVWHGWTLGQIQNHLREAAPSELPLFTLPLQISDETIADFCRRGPLYLERTVLPLISTAETVTGYLIVFKDVTYEVSSDRLDSVTGLPTNTEVARILSRRVAWTLRHSGIPCRHIAAARLRLEGMDSYREHHGQQAVEEILLAAASVLRLCSSDSMVIVRSGLSDFLIYAVDQPPEGCHRQHQRIQEKLNGLIGRDGQPLQLQAGWAVRRLHESDFSEVSRMEDELRRAFRDTLRVADKALQKALVERAEAMLYTADDGFISL